jgi:hypothetical protein
MTEKEIILKKGTAVAQLLLIKAKIKIKIKIKIIYFPSTDTIHAFIG